MFKALKPSVLQHGTSVANVEYQWLEPRFLRNGILNNTFGRIQDLAVYHTLLCQLLVVCFVGYACFF